MKSIVVFVLFFGHFAIVAQVKDIEIIEERAGSEIKLFATNNTADVLDMTMSINITGFISSEKSNPIQKTLQPKAKELLTILSAPPNTECEYSTSISYKKARKTNPIAIKEGQKQRSTSVQMNTNKLNVFTQDGCGRCEFVIDYLEKNNIPYVELNTSIHDPNQDLMFEKLTEAGFKGNSVQMPVIVTKEKTAFNIKDLKTYVKSIK